jgi:Relaxase/Mobilisation nuclease domain
VPIIINGASRRAGGWWAKHLENEATNERVEVVEIVGLSAATLPDAFREMHALSRGTKCDNYFYQANINPRADEKLTPEQWQKAVDTLEKNLGLTGQPRFVIEHEKEGRTHRHVVWSRIDTERMVAIPDSLTAAIHERTSRELEIRFDLERGRSILVPDREFDRPDRRPKKHETIRALDGGLDPQTVKAEVSALWRSADNAQSFKAALEERGYILARGDRRDFVIIDPAGDDHSLARRASVKAAELRERMKEIDPASLPSVIEARAEQRAIATERAPNFDRDAADAAWMEQVTAAAIAKEEGLSPAPGVQQQPEPAARRYDPLRATERAVERAQFKGHYDELRAAELPLEVAQLFEATAARAAEPPAVNFDRDAADAAWQEKVATAGIASDAARTAQESRQPAEPATGRETRAGAGGPSHASPEAQEMAQQAAALNDHNLRDLAGFGSRFLGGLAAMTERALGGLLSFFSPAEPKLTPDQAERTVRAAEERAETRAQTSAEQEKAAAQDWLIFQQDRQQQQKEMDLATRFGTPLTRDANTGREHDYGRERERDRW